MAYKVRGQVMIHWTAVCQYPDKKEFAFFSPTFVVENWNSLEKTAQAVVDDAWADISPHPAPPIVKLIPGYLQYHKE